MEHYDPEKAARVWQRVRSEMPPVPDRQLQPVILLEQENAGTYLSLASRMPSKAGSRLRQLAAQNHDHIACLKGMCILQDVHVPNLTSPQQVQNAFAAGLRLCFRREMQCHAAYMERASDPEFGAVFAQLAADKRRQCRAILELLGKGGK